MAQRGNKITTEEMDYLFAVANSKATLAGKPYNPGAWRSELERLRQNLFFFPGQFYADSGPWPVQGLATEYAGYNVVDFFFAATSDTAAAQSVDVVNTGAMDSSDPAYLHWQPGNPWPYNLTCKIKIGGEGPARFRGRFFFSVAVGSAGFAVTASTDFPGVTGWSRVGDLWMTDPIDVTVSPGVYTFQATASASPFRYPWVSAYNINFPAVLPPVVWELTATTGNATAAPGIHDTLGTWRIHASPRAASGNPDIEGLGFGIYMLYQNGQWGVNPNSYRATVAGLWAARTAMISSLGNPIGYLPWNEIDDLGVPNGEITEQKLQPYFSTQLASWPANTDVVAGAWLVANGFWQRATNAGRTGGSSPAWPAQHGGMVQDGAVRWQALECFGVPARCVCVPCYPYKRVAAAPADSPEAFANWNRFKLGWLNPASPIYRQFWWLRRIRLNRIWPAAADSNTHRFGASIPVTLGCMRNGSFHPFGTFNTGAWVSHGIGTDPASDHLLWPIFDKSPLVYQADEPIDVQAEIIPGIPTPGYLLDFPILADYYNDTLALLNLIG